MIYVETSRLRLRDWQASDLEPFRQMNADEAVMTYFPETLSIAKTDAFYQSIIAEINDYGFGLYAVEEKQSQAFIGFIGFHRATFSAEFTPCVEIGWRLKKEAWGRGYATEGAIACLDYGFNELNLAEIYSFTAAVNQPSENVMQKIGMTFMKTFEHPAVKADSYLKKHVLYHICQ